MTREGNPAGASASATRRQLLGGALSVGAVAAAGCLGIGSGGASGGDDGEVSEGQGLINVQNHDIQEGPFDTYVNGTIKNVHNSPVRVEVDVTFLDENGNQLSDPSDSERVKPDAVWQFELEFEGENAGAIAEYELEARAEETGE